MALGDILSQRESRKVRPVVGDGGLVTSMGSVSINRHNCVIPRDFSLEGSHAEFPWPVNRISAARQMLRKLSMTPRVGKGLQN